MALTDPEVSALARQAVDLLAPDIAVEIDPAAADDPYRFGATSWLVWPLLDGHRSFGIHIESRWTPARALAQLVDALIEYGSESERLWGRPALPCPAHAHAVDVVLDDSPDAAEVVLRCPSSGADVARIRPAV